MVHFQQNAVIKGGKERLQAINERTITNPIRKLNNDKIRISFTKFKALIHLWRELEKEKVIPRNI